MQHDPALDLILPYLARLPHRPCIVELGVHWGESTHGLLAACSRPPIWYGWEPDPRNVVVCREAGLAVRPAAASDRNGVTTLHMSGGLTPGSADRVHTDSSSIAKPTRHLAAHPWCTFAESCDVETERVDDVVPEWLGIDLMWVDVQGAQRLAFAGARSTLSRTRWLFCELHPVPMYDGEPGSLEELVGLLPGKWDVVARYPADVLLMKGGE
jgi:FkbM family methyltransferase